MGAIGNQLPFELTARSKRPSSTYCPMSGWATSPHSAGSTLASMATTSGRANRSRRGSGRYATRARRPWMPLGVRFRTDSAMIPLLEFNPVREREAQVPADGQEDHLGFKLAPLEQAGNRADKVHLASVSPPGSKVATLPKSHGSITLNLRHCYRWLPPDSLPWLPCKTPPPPGWSAA
jgi:hypothetical protein